MKRRQEKKIEIKFHRIQDLQVYLHRETERERKREKERERERKRKKIKDKRNETKTWRNTFKLQFMHVLSEVTCYTSLKEINGRANKVFLHSIWQMGILSVLSAIKRCNSLDIKKH